MGVSSHRVDSRFAHSGGPHPGGLCGAPAPGWPRIEPALMVSAAYLTAIICCAWAAMAGLGCHGQFSHRFYDGFLAVFLAVFRLGRSSF
ncbi:hypothetical protein KESI111651_00490 [Kerstersia similis]